MKQNLFLPNLSLAPMVFSGTGNRFRINLPEKFLIYQLASDFFA